MNDSHLMGGAARQVISPPRGIYLAGYNTCNRGSAGKHDELLATCLVLDDGETKIAFLSCDLFMVNEELVDEIRIEIEPEISLVLCCTNSHSAPIGYADIRSSPKLQRYIGALKEKLITVIREAEQNMEPIHLELIQGEVGWEVYKQAGMLLNENPIQEDMHSSIIDRSLLILNVHRNDGSRVAMLLNFACQPSFLGCENLLISADWVGVMRNQVEKELGGLSIFLQGAAGNLHPKSCSKRPEALKHMEETAHSVAKAVIDACQGNAIPISPVPFQLIRQETWLPFDVPVTSTKPPFPDENFAYMTRIPKVFSRLARIFVNWRIPWKPRLDEEEGFWATPLRINAIRIGDLGIITFGAEPSHEIGLEIKENSPAPYTMFVSGTDGSIGKLPGQEKSISSLIYRLPGMLSEDNVSEALENAYAMMDELWFVENLLNDDEP